MDLRYSVKQLNFFPWTLPHFVVLALGTWCRLLLHRIVPHLSHDRFPGHWVDKVFPFILLTGSISVLLAAAGGSSSSPILSRLSFLTEKVAPMKKLPPELRCLILSVTEA